MLSYLRDYLAEGITLLLGVGLFDDHEQPLLIGGAEHATIQLGQELLDDRRGRVDVEVGYVDESAALHDLLQLAHLRLVARHAPDVLLQRALLVHFQQ